ncbi:protein PIN-LIKES 2-like isoform X4 [Malus sylvestris]|uniref:protein PIN-LIKES 2-like isoform X4 n=1 Tax=Malus sylvestris TaxID=3752 RepID=UPI0021ABFB82|nr:protein PIN-LIKES 2-like isoform X4 [Malus sylvestris]
MICFESYGSSGLSVSSTLWLSHLNLISIESLNRPPNDCFGFKVCLISSFVIWDRQNMEILPAMQGSNLKGGLLLSAVLPLLKLLSMAAIGFLLAHPKYQLVPKLTFTFLSKLVFAVFLPCLIFTNLGPSISLKNFVNWWFIPVNVVISTAIGCVLGLLVAVICRPPPQFFRFTVIMTAFGNTVVEEEENHEIAELGLDGNGNGNGNRDESDLARPLLVEAEWPGIEDKETEHCKTPFIARLFNSSNGVLSHTSLSELGEEEEEGGYPRSTKPSKCLAEPRIVRKFRYVAWRTPIHRILQPPTIAFLLAVVIGMIPTLKSLVFDDDQVLSFLTDSLEIVAEAMVPSAVLVLGGMLAEGPNESNLGMRTTIGIIVARLLVLPLIGIGVVLLSDKLNLLVADDQLYRFVLLLQYTTPSAILLGAVASLRGYAVREASALLFWQHIVAVFSLSLYIIVYFYILF